MKVYSFFDDVIDTDCVKCGLHTKCSDPYASVTGLGEKKILIVTETPETTENISYLKKQLSFVGINLHEDCWMTSTVLCSTDAELSDKQISLCHKNLDKVIKDKRPSYIVLMGDTSIKGMIGGHVHTNSPDSLSGNKIPYRGMWIFPTHSLTEVTKNKHNENIKAYFKYNLMLISEEVADPTTFTKFDYISPVRIETDPNAICDWLDDLLDNPVITAMDIESSGLNIFKKGHTTFCMAISKKDESLSFPIDYPTDWTDEDYENVIDRVVEYLEREDLKKIIHNSQFDSIWCSVYFKCKVGGVYWCSKLAAHILDNRKSVTGLKHIAFVKWGIENYDKESEKYIQALPGSNFNQMHKMPLYSMLLYCGIDAFLTIKLYYEQYKSINLEVMSFFNEANNMLSEMRVNGIKSDIDYYAKQKLILQKEISDGYKELLQSDEVKRFGKHDFNFNSSDDLKDFFYTFLKCPVLTTTEKGKPSVDEKALEKTDHWIAKRIIELRKINKVVNTYIAQFEREVCDGVIHPSFLLTIARSFRSSSVEPNFQNLPKRFERAKLLVRSGLRPSKGNRLIEVDFSGAEVITASSYNKDPVLIAYLWPEEGKKAGDMHRDNAADIWCTVESDISKKVRFYAKNCWTFPQFYGDWYDSCAKSLWEHKEEKLVSGLTCEQHLKSKGIKNLKQFIKHCQKAERIMWGERFKVYNEWREEMQVYYQTHLTVPTYLGFEFKGYMDRKQVTNYNIQGTSFHMLLKVLLKMRKWLKENDMKTLMIGQIHDSGIFDSPEYEVRSVIAQFQKYTEELYDEYEWMEVPMSMEAEVSLVDGDLGHLFTYKEEEDFESMEKEAQLKWTT